MNQPRTLSLRQIIVSNILWLLVSLALAFLVWMTAVAQRDPIEELQLPGRIPIQFLVDDTMLMTSTSIENVAVRARGQRSAISLLTSSDITISADMRGMSPGAHAITLATEVQRERILLDTVPRQVNVTLELLQSRLVPVVVTTSGVLPGAYEQGDPEIDRLEVEVSGAASQVERVAQARITLDVSDARTTITALAALTPVDDAGQPVDGITLDPGSIAISLPIRPRPDVREISVQPNLIGVDNMPEGYLLSQLDYEPRSVLVSGPAELLDSLPETIFTEAIDLRDRTAAFEASVPIELPSRDLIVLAGGVITVRIGISTQTASQQFDNIPVEIIGLSDGLTAELSPATVSLLVTGPEPQIAGLEARDIRVIVDLNQLAAGTYPLIPQPALAQGIAPEVTFSVLPASIDVQISAPATQPAATATPRR
jgi:YbbR domain-containing protein